MKGIIPIGGRGTRMRPLTFTANKHFIPVGNKLLIFYPIETLVKAGIKHIGITYNPGQLEYAKNILGTGSKWGANFNYILQEKPIGLANIVYVCEKWLNNEHFVLHLGDNIFVDGINDFVAYFNEKKPDGLLAMLHHHENKRMGVPYFSSNGQLKKLVEKPSKPPNDYAIPGIYFANKNFFKAFKGKDKIRPSERGEYEITSAFQWLIDHKYSVEIKEYKGKWLDPGKFGDWLETNQYLLDSFVQNKIESRICAKTLIEGRVEIGKNCKIKNSTIRGPVSIGNNVILRDSFVGPYTSIYHSCQLYNCTIENSVIMEGTIIRNVQKRIDSSIIGPMCEIEGNSNQTTQFFVGEMGKISL